MRGNVYKDICMRCYVRNVWNCYMNELEEIVRNALLLLTIFGCEILNGKK
jgi:hypothetical protein